MDTLARDFEDFSGISRAGKFRDGRLVRPYLSDVELQGFDAGQAANKCRALHPGTNLIVQQRSGFCRSGGLDIARHVETGAILPA